jgi:hypothetical protein
MKTIDVTLTASGITVNPPSTDIDALEQVTWNVTGATDWELTIWIPATVIVIGGALPTNYTVPSDPYPVTRVLDSLPHTLRSLGSNRFPTSYAITLRNPNGLNGPIVHTVSVPLVIERGVEPIGKGPHELPTEFPLGYAGIRDPLPEEQRLAQ